MSNISKAGTPGKPPGEGNGDNQGWGAFPRPVPFSQLVTGSADTLWLWRGLLARGGCTLFSALWKAGKTTLLAHLLRALGNGGQLCGLDVQPGRVLLVSEEYPGLWAERRNRLGIGDHVALLARPYFAKPSLSTWRAFVDYLVGERDKWSADVVILDTLSRLWPVQEENHAGQVMEALIPLQALTQGAGLLLVHHLRKGDGGEATGSRGSGALTGHVDIIVELRRLNSALRICRKRTLTAYGRYQGVPEEEIVVELAAGGDEYLVHGSPAGLQLNGRLATIAALLPGEPPGWTWEQVKDHWPSEPAPHKGKLLRALHAGVESGIWQQQGSGFKNDPFRFWKPADSVPVPVP